MMNSPTAALVWKCWRASAKVLVFSQIIIISLSCIIIPNFLDASTPEAGDVVANVLICLGLTLLFATISTISAKGTAYRFSGGFPLQQEFTLPITTSRLVLIPLLFYCGIFIFSYAAPLLLLQQLFGIQGPQWIAALILIQTMLIFLSLAWFTTNNTLQGIAWSCLFGFYFLGWAFPDLSLENNSVKVLYASANSFIAPMAITIGSLVLLFLGVSKQRFGENLYSVSKHTQLFDVSNSGHTLIGIPSRSCPVDSPSRAQIWREGRLRGVNYSLVVGATAGIIALLMAKLIVIGRAEEVGQFEHVPPIAATMSFMYFIYFVLIHSQAFGIRYRNGAGSISLIDKMVPMGTAQLNLLQMSSLLLSSIVGAFAMITVIAAFGAVFLNGFTDFRTETIIAISSDVTNSPLGSLFAVFKILTNVLVASLVFSVFNAWTIINQKQIFRIAIGLFAYIMLFVALLLFVLTDDTLGGDSWLDFILVKHLWLLVVGGPVALYYCYKYCINENILTTRQIQNLLTVTVMLLVASTASLIRDDFYNSDAALEIKLLKSMWSIAPVFAIGLSLVTLSKIRHG